MVVEFPRDLPSTGFITLAFYDELTREPLGAVPTAQLGARTLKGNFPGESFTAFTGQNTFECARKWLSYWLRR